MIRMFPRRRTELTLAPGLDAVIFGISLPSDCILNNLSAEVHVIDQAIQSAGVARMFAIQGYVLPVLDPDAAASFDVIWDTLVPKDDDTDTIDLDTAAADTQSMYEPGEAAMAEVMDVGLQPKRIYSMQRLKTFANASMRQESVSLNEWALSEVIKIRIRKRHRVQQPSVVLFALGNPDMLDTSSTPPTALSENEWPRVKYMELVLEQALMQHFGLTEAGATTPWIDAAQLLRKYIEPDVFELNGAAFGNGTLKAYVNATFDVSVPGRMDKIQIGTGG